MSSADEFVLSSSAKSRKKRDKTIAEKFFGVFAFFTSLAEMPENPFTDFENDAWNDHKKWKIMALTLNNVGFIAVVLYFVITAYIDGRTNSFISIDKSAGVCKDDASSKECCEVPQSITGTFFADTQGRWNTEPGFSVVNNSYAVTLAGLEYTNLQWKQVMQNITSQMAEIGQKGANRDFSWNLVAWSSFNAQNRERGFLQFYATGDAQIIFDKPIRNSGFASAQSQTKECTADIETTYSSATSKLEIITNLCSTPPCENPCPGILAPQAMGYNTFITRESEMVVEVDIQAVSTALSINMGMNKLNQLVMVPTDSERISLLTEMVRQGYITQSVADNTTSYYDILNAPTNPVYCYSSNKPELNSTTWESGDAFCLVRMGNTLAFPVTTSFGWSTDSTSYRPNAPAKPLK